MLAIYFFLCSLSLVGIYTDWLAWTCIRICHSVNFIQPTRSNLVHIQKKMGIKRISSTKSTESEKEKKKSDCRLYVHQNACAATVNPKPANIKPFKVEDKQNVFLFIRPQFNLTEKEIAKIIIKACSSLYSPKWFLCIHSM